MYYGCRVITLFSSADYRNQPGIYRCYNPAVYGQLNGRFFVLFFFCHHSRLRIYPRKATGSAVPSRVGLLIRSTQSDQRESYLHNNFSTVLYIW